MLARGQNFKPVPINICGSSVFGRYPKISIEKTLNMFQSDTFMVPYGGYAIAALASQFANELTGRAIFTSTKLNKMVVVLDNNVYLVDIFFNQMTDQSFNLSKAHIGTLQTSSGVVYITENNKPQIVISDNLNIYVYDPAVSATLQIATKDGTNPISFTPGYISFHDTYVLVASSNDQFYNPPSNNTWRLSENNNALLFPDDASHIGLLQTKPDDTQAVLRFPSKGNMIFVMGQNVTEAWFDTGAQLFPYQRTNQFNIDYGCLNPATVAYMDEFAVWLAGNEKSGAIIMHSSGGMPEKITTDGIDYLFSQMIDPSDSQGFLYRQDGHLFYHINFYTDNLSLFVDFLPDGTHKIYHASDQNLDYFIAAQVAFFNNQYYFVSKNTGNLYAFDTIFTTYTDTDSLGNVIVNEIPRFRTCRNVRMPSQEYYLANDLGFTIETGETNYQQQSGTGTGGLFGLLNGGDFLLLSGQTFSLLGSNNIYTTPRVDLSISTDGGASFGNDMPYVLNPIGKRKNKLQWWQMGIVNDFVPLFKFWGMGRFVATDGVLNTRQ